MPRKPRRIGSNENKAERVFSGFPLKPINVLRRVYNCCDADNETDRIEYGAPITSKRASAGSADTSANKLSSDSDVVAGVALRWILLP